MSLTLSIFIGRELKMATEKQKNDLPLYATFYMKVNSIISLTQFFKIQEKILFAIINMKNTPIYLK